MASRSKPLLQPALFDLVNPPVKPSSVELSIPERKEGISDEERAMCLELLGHDREEITCSLCGKVFLLFTWHLKTCPLSPGGVGSTRQESPQSPTQSAPKSGLAVEVLGTTRPQAHPDTWIGHSTTCHICKEVVPTAKHLDLIHDSHGEGLRSRLLSAYLWPDQRVRAEQLGLDVAGLRALILCGGNLAREAELKRLAGEQRELSPNADPSSLTEHHPYKGPGVKDGASMAPEKWRGK